ncbi:tachykinin-like peptides receptor 99D [Porites lutea]|uniref:tachykinin-like peptides receptor 99D n=1 Tax=Porites lutea TaxID=51062 RepID=UPI003CC5062C
MDFSLTIKVVFTFLTSLAFIVSFFGNSMVIYIIRKDQLLKSTTFLLILNMACGDLVTTSMTSPPLIKFLIIIYHLWTRHIPGEPSALQQQKANRMARKITKMMIAVVLSFFICWAPQFIFVWIHPLARELARTLPIWLIPFILWLQVLNSAMNPVLYAIFSEPFRLGFRKVIFRNILPGRNAQVVQSAHQNVHQRYQNPIQNIALVRFHNSAGLQR